MSAPVIRRVVLAVCVVGIAGMIVTNIAGNSGGSMTFGLITAVAILCSIVATAVSVRPPGGATGEALADELGEQVEARIASLAETGVDEGELRALVADAVRLGRVTS